MTADARPSLEGGRTVSRPWRGLFRDHAVIGGRRIPTYAEVGYVYERGYSPYWRGRVIDFSVHAGDDVVG